MTDVFHFVVKFPRDGMPAELMPYEWISLLNARGYAINLAGYEIEEGCGFSAYEIFEGTKAEAEAYVADYNR